MTKIIYYCDLHSGSLTEASSSTDVRLYGNYAIDMNQALFAYASVNNVEIIIHGGDESSFVKTSNRSNHHLDRAGFIGDSMNYLQGDLHRVIGNHEPIDHLEELGFKTKSFRKKIDRRNTLLIYQPTIETTPNGTNYSYDDQKIIRPSKSTKPATTNLIVSSHWAFDRMHRGYPKHYNKGKGYTYHDNTEPLAKVFATHARGNTARVLTLHGHEHRFSMNDDLGFQCLVMPSIMQADFYYPNKPCGLFAEITDDGPDNELCVTFKKISLDVDDADFSPVKPVSRDYMNKYFRPVII
jgi:hypothetical protein